jgi:hypothetical protein
VTRRQRSAAFDLGLTPEARAAYHDRLDYMFREACIMFGPAEAARLFRAQAKTAPKPARGKRTAPPQKRKGSHDPETDKYLVQLWLTGSWEGKHDFARRALKNHSVTIRKKIVGKVTGKNSDQDEREVKSLIRRLDRALQRRAASLRQIGRRKTKA